MIGRGPVPLTAPLRKHGSSGASCHQCRRYRHRDVVAGRGQEHGFGGLPDSSRPDFAPDSVAISQSDIQRISPGRRADTRATSAIRRLGKVNMEALKWPIVDFFQALAAGLLVGGTYGLMCVGLGIIFGVMRVVNFAQGDFMMLGMYVTYYLVTGFGVLAFLGPYAGPVAGAVLAGPIIFALGWLLHRFLISRVTGARVVSAEAEGHYAQIIMTLGVALVLSNGGLILFGSVPLSVQTPLSRESWEIGLIFSIRRAPSPSCWRSLLPSGFIYS